MGHDLCIKNRRYFKIFSNAWVGNLGHITADSTISPKKILMTSHFPSCLECNLFQKRKQNPNARVGFFGIVVDSTVEKKKSRFLLTVLIMWLTAYSILQLILWSRRFHWMCPPTLTTVPFGKIGWNVDFYLINRKRILTVIPSLTFLWKYEPWIHNSHENIIW